MHDRIEPLLTGGTEDDLGGPLVGLAHLAGTPGVEGEDRRGVHHRVTPDECLRHHLRVAHVADHDRREVVPTVAPRAQRVVDLVGPPYQQRDPVPGVEQPGHQAGADETGPAGDQDVHGTGLPRCRAG